MAATDDYGVYYTEYVGTGYNDNSKLFRIKPGGKEAEIVFSTEDSMGFNLGEKNAEYVWISLGNTNTIYSLDTMEPVQMEWEYQLQPAFSYPVPGGFAVPKNQPIDGQDKHYIGEEWKFLRMQDGIYQ